MQQLVQPIPNPFPPGARILVAEPDPARAMALGAILARAGVEITVVRTRRAARREAVDSDKPYQGAVIQADLLGPESDDVVTLLRKRQRPCFSIVLVPHEAEELGRVALTLGALEVMAQDCEPDRVLEATTRAVEASRALWKRIGVVPKFPRTAPHLSLHEGPRRKLYPDLHQAVTAISCDASLSSRESAVLEMIVAGFRYADIGRELSIAPRTVKMHAANVRKKAKVRNRYELLRMVYER